VYQFVLAIKDCVIQSVLCYERLPCGFTVTYCLSFPCPIRRNAQIKARPHGDRRMRYHWCN